MTRDEMIEAALVWFMIGLLFGFYFLVKLGALNNHVSGFPAWG